MRQYCVLVCVCVRISFYACLTNKGRQSIEILLCAVHHGNLYPFHSQCSVHTLEHNFSYHKLFKWTERTQTILPLRKIECVLVMVLTFKCTEMQRMQTKWMYVLAFSTLIWLDFVVPQRTLTAYIRNSNSLLNCECHKLILSLSFPRHFSFDFMLCIQFQHTHSQRNVRWYSLSNMATCLRTIFTLTAADGDA